MQPVQPTWEDPSSRSYRDRTIQIEEWDHFLATKFLVFRFRALDEYPFHPRSLLIRDHIRWHLQNETGWARGVLRRRILNHHRNRFLRRHALDLLTFYEWDVISEQECMVLLDRARNRPAFTSSILRYATASGFSTLWSRALNILQRGSVSPPVATS